MADEKISSADYVDVTNIDSKKINEKIAATHVISQKPYDAVSHNTNIGDPAFIGSGILIGLNSAISIFVRSFLAWVSSALCWFIMVFALEKRQF